MRNDKIMGIDKKGTDKIMCIESWSLSSWRPLLSLSVSRILQHTDPVIWSSWSSPSSQFYSTTHQGSRTWRTFSDPELTQNHFLRKRRLRKRESKREKERERYRAREKESQRKRARGREQEKEREVEWERGWEKESEGRRAREREWERWKRKRERLSLALSFFLLFCLFPSLSPLSLTHSLSLSPKILHFLRSGIAGSRNFCYPAGQHSQFLRCLLYMANVLPLYCCQHIIANILHCQYISCSNCLPSNSRDNRIIHLPPALAYHPCLEVPCIFLYLKEKHQMCILCNMYTKQQNILQYEF